MPKRIAGSATSHIPVSNLGWRKCAARCARVCGSSGLPAGASAAATAIAAPSAATPPKTGRVPKEAAAPPTAGPISAPPIPAASAEPISSPRRSLGARDTSQARDPVHVHAPPKPWQNRATSSTTTLPANPNTRLVATRSPSPSRTVGFTPSRTASRPEGTEPASVPTPNAAVRTPAPAFDSPSVSA